MIPIFLTIPNFLALTIISRPYRVTQEDLETTMASMQGDIDCLPNKRNGTHTICNIPEHNETDINSLYPSRYFKFSDILPINLVIIVILVNTPAYKDSIIVIST